jgi:transposase
MRYELSDNKWSTIKTMLPGKTRGVPSVDDRRVLHGVSGCCGSGPWRDLRDSFGPYTTCYNCFVRWRRAGVSRRIMEALAGAPDAAVQMIDTSIVRAHHHGVCGATVRPLRHHQTKGAATDIPDLTPPRRIPTLPQSSRSLQATAMVRNALKPDL